MSEANVSFSFVLLDELWFCICGIQAMCGVSCV